MLLKLINIGILIVALIHLWFCVLEMFLWQKPLGLKIFKLQPEFAKQSAVLAANQGLYNLFLSAGLIWSLIASDASQAFQLKIFFLCCVLIAGIFGAITASKRIILVVQAMPAVVCLLLLLV